MHVSVRVLLATALLLMAGASSFSQTVSAIANGTWNDAAVWSCNCIPAPGDDVFISDSLSINTMGAVTISSITVGSLAVFSVNSGTLTVNGSVTVNASGALNNAYIVEISGNMTNNGSLSGPGTYCIGGVTTNSSTGSILGPMDFCDLTPPGSSPFIDNNSGYVQGNVLFCQNGICTTTDLDETPPESLPFIDVVNAGASRHVVVRLLNQADWLVELYDLAGRTAWSSRMTSARPSAALPREINGIYLYRVTSKRSILGQGKILIR